MKKTIIVMIILLLSLSGCGKGNTPTEYLSIASTTYIDPTTEKMVTSIHQYIPSTKTMTKVFNFDYTSQYPLGVFNEETQKVYYTKRDSNNRDQIYSYDLDTKEEKQLTTTLRAVNQIIPIKDKLFFVASLDKVLKLGMLNLVDGNITYWGDEDTNVETIAINPLTEKIYVSGFSFSKDQENINNQFISDDNTYNMPLFTVYETDYTFTETKALFAGDAWIRNILVDFSTNRVVALYDKEYNSDEDSQAVAIDVRTETIEQFQLPPERMQVDGGSFSRDRKGLYVLSVINDQRGVYYYDFETKAYTPILLMEDEFINNFQFVQE